MPTAIEALTITTEQAIAGTPKVSAICIPSPSGPMASTLDYFIQHLYK